MGILGDGLIARRAEGDICLLERLHSVGYSIIAARFDFLSTPPRTFPPNSVLQKGPTGAVNEIASMMPDARSDHHNSNL